MNVNCAELNSLERMKGRNLDLLFFHQVLFNLNADMNADFKAYGHRVVAVNR